MKDFVPNFQRYRSFDLLNDSTTRVWEVSDFLKKQLQHFFRVFSKKSFCGIICTLSYTQSIGTKIFEFVVVIGKILVSESVPRLMCHPVCQKRPKYSGCRNLSRISVVNHFKAKTLEGCNSYSSWWNFTLWGSF